VSDLTTRPLSDMYLLKLYAETSAKKIVVVDQTRFNETIK